MRYGFNRVNKRHKQTRKAHYNTYSLTHNRLITMHTTFRTGRLFVAKLTTIEPLVGISQQTIAIAAQTA